MHQPVPFDDANPAARSNARFLMFDVDDTVTWKGQLPEVSARALYAAKAAGLELVAVTGRSFSWGEMLMRLFPLTAAIAETGACALVRRGHRVELLHHEPDAMVRAANARDRERAATRVLAEVNSARLAMDNPGRLYDVAFDLVEDGPPISAEDAAMMRAILHDEGLTTAQSSVHINAWKVGPHGAFDKATMTDRVLRERYGISLDEARAYAVYVGDSTNDGAMFVRVDLSVGVGNIRPHLEALGERAPRYIVDGSGGHGFAQVVASLIEDR
jgi:HAD superfamily hydrolase (TIGR01484 family)